MRETHFGKYDSNIMFLALHGLCWGEESVRTHENISDNKVHIKRGIHGFTKTQSGVRTVPDFGHVEEFPKTLVPITKVLEPHGPNILDLDLVTGLKSKRIV